MLSSFRMAAGLIFVVFPLLEILVLIKAGETIGFWPTIGLLFAAAALGVVVVREQGLSMVTKAMSSLNEGRLPLAPLLDSQVMVFAGMLLIAPGFISDIIGLALLVPPVRRLAIRSAMSRFAPGWTPPQPAQRDPQKRGPTVIEGSFKRLDEHDAEPKDES
jgi:UPF0716 protein FxsA